MAIAQTAEASAYNMVANYHIRIRSPVSTRTLNFENIRGIISESISGDLWDRFVGISAATTEWALDMVGWSQARGDWWLS
jgi:hypothetical protein